MRFSRATVCRQSSVGEDSGNSHETGGFGLLRDAVGRVAPSSRFEASARRLAGEATGGYLWRMLRGKALKRLEVLRGRLEALGQRPSMQFPSASPAVVEAMGVVEKYGPMCEAMYLIMAADGRVLNVEREVLRGALEVLGEGEVRTAHMEAMLDAAARASAHQGTEQRLAAVIESLAGDPIKAELTALLCAAVALADGELPPEEEKMYERLAAGFGLAEQRADELLAELEHQMATR